MRHRHTCCSLLNQIVIDSVDPWQRLMETKQAESEMRKESDKSKKRSEAREAERLHAAAAAFAATNVKTYVVDRDTHTERERERISVHTLVVLHVSTQGRTTTRSHAIAD
jgi:hypothetical protein